jgi:hypothetical protein
VAVLEYDMRRQKDNTKMATRDFVQLIRQSYKSQQIQLQASISLNESSLDSQSSSENYMEGSKSKFSKGQSLSSSLFLTQELPRRHNLGVCPVASGNQKSKRNLLIQCKQCGKEFISSKNRAWKHILGDHGPGSLTPCSFPIIFKEGEGPKIKKQKVIPDVDISPDKKVADEAIHMFLVANSLPQVLDSFVEFAST